MDATLERADLRGSCLRASNLRATDFSDADLSGANLKDIELEYKNTNIHEAIGVSQELLAMVQACQSAG